MKRKVVKLGPATLVVSLPNKWVRKFDVKAGDDIEIEEQDKDLVVKTKKRFKFEKETLYFNKIDKLIKRILASRYLKGADEIEIFFNTLGKSRTVQKRVDDMIGMEIIEQEKDRLLVKDMGTGAEDNFDNILKRVLYLLNSLSEETLKAITNRETDLEYLEDAEKNLNKFTDYCFRLLNKKGYSDYKKTSVLYCVLFLLEDLGDEYKQLVAFINENKLKLAPNLIKVYERINNYHENFQKLFLRFSFESAINLAQERDSLIKEIEKCLRTSKSSKEIIVLKNFENIINTIIKIMGQLLNIN